MENVGIGQILLLLFFIVLPLVNFLLQRVRKRREHRSPQEKPVEPIATQLQTSRSPRLARRADRGQAPTSPARPVAPLAHNRFTKRSLLGSPRDVRRGIVIMTLLGPCRAFDPPD